MKKINVIVKRPFEPVGRLKKIDNTHEALQRIVGGYIETVTVTPDVVIICNEEGRLMGLPDNCSICGVNFVGTIIAAGVKRDRFTDFPGTLEKWEEMWLK